jgi:hypothetical protein
MSICLNRGKGTTQRPTSSSYRFKGKDKNKMTLRWPNISRNPPLPPFKKGGMGGFLARMRLIQNAAFDHVNLFWPFPIV